MKQGRSKMHMVMQTTGNSLISSTVFALLVTTIRSEISICGTRRTNGCTWLTHRLHAFAFRRVRYVSKYSGKTMIAFQQATRAETEPFGTSADTFTGLVCAWYAPGMCRSVNDFVQTGDSRQRNKRASIRTDLLQPIPIPVKPWESISMDFIMGLPNTERQHNAIFTFADRLTKYAHMVPTEPTIDAEGAARLYVNNLFAYRGLSKSIVSDRDPRFTSAFLKEVFSLLGVTQYEYGQSSRNLQIEQACQQKCGRHVEIFH